MSFGLLRCGMARSFQKDHHLNANLKIHRTQKAGPVIKPLYLLAKKTSCILFPQCLQYITLKYIGGYV
jgi:hypothetical protein